MKRFSALLCAAAVAAAGSTQAQGTDTIQKKYEIEAEADEGVRYSGPAFPWVDDQLRLEEAPGWRPHFYQNSQDVLLRSTEQKNNYIVKTFPIYNTDAIEIQSYLLRSAAFENAVVEVMGKDNVIDPRTGDFVQFLIVTAPDFMMPGIAEMVAYTDIEGFRFFDGTGEVNADGIPGAIPYVGKHRTASQLLTILSGTELGNVGAFLFPPFADNSLNTIYIVENPTDIADDLLALEAFDKPPLQVAIQATIYELYDGNGSTLGLDWSAWKRYISGSFEYDYVNEMDDTTVKSYSAMLELDAKVLAEFLNYLVDEGKAQVVTETTLVATNDFDPSDASGQPGRLARLFSGNIIPFITPVSDTADVSVSPERKDIQEGVELLIKPFIAAESVSLDIDVFVRSLVGYVPDTHFPIVSTQEVNSFNTVTFGETIVIGGLERSSEVTHETGFPLLKDIPVLGYLFTKKSKQEQETKLIVTLTPELQSPFESDEIDM